MRKSALLVSLSFLALALPTVAQARLRYDRPINIITSNYDLVDTTYIDRGRLDGVKVGDKFAVKFPDGKMATQVMVTGVFERMASVKIVDSWLLKDGQLADFKQRPMVVALERGVRRPSPDITVKAKSDGAKAAAPAVAPTAAPDAAPAAPAPAAVTDGLPPAAPGGEPGLPGAPDAGLPPADGGLPAAPDAGLPPADGGLPPSPDAGLPAPDAGLPAPDAGLPPALDGGLPPAPDAGPPMDGGEMPGDPGLLPPPM